MLSSIVPRRLAGRMAGGMAVLLMGIVPLARADLYGYVDENGVAHLAAKPLDSRYRPIVRAGVNVDAQAGASGASVSRKDRSKIYDALARHPALKRLAPLIERAATRYHLDPALIKAVMAAESGFDPTAVSDKGAVGLMQVLPETGERYGVRADARRTVADKLVDPAINVLTGARYLSDLQAMYPARLELVLAAYNAGERAVEKHDQQIPPYAETRGYVDAVLELYRRFDPDGPAALASRAGQGDGTSIRPLSLSGRPGAQVNGARNGRLHVILGAPTGLPVVPAPSPVPTATQERNTVPGVSSSD